MEVRKLVEDVVISGAKPFVTGEVTAVLKRKEQRIDMRIFGRDRDCLERGGCNRYQARWERKERGMGRGMGRGRGASTKLGGLKYRK